MVERNYRQWRTVVEYVERRRNARYDEEMIGEVRDHFEHDRGKLLRSVGKTAQDVVGGYDRDRESELLANSIQTAVARTAAIESGVLGLWGLVVALSATLLHDPQRIQAVPLSVAH